MEFCCGNWATLIWGDMLLTVAGGDAVADAVFPDESDAAYTTMSGGTGRTATVRKERGKNEGVNDPGEESDMGGLGNKRR